MHKLLASIVSAIVVLFGMLALLLGASNTILDVLGRGMTALSLTDQYNDLIDWIAAHPGLAVDMGPWLLIVAGIGSLCLIHIWPHAARDLLRRKRIKCVFDPKIRGCLLATQATLRLEEMFPAGRGVTSYLPTTTALVTGGFAAPEECFLVRIQIRSGGDYEIDNCSASLISICTGDGRYIYNDGPIALTIMPAERPDPETKHLFPNSAEYVDVFRLTESSQVRIMSRLLPASTDLDRVFSTSGDFIFKVAINGKECPRETIKIGLRWEQNWTTATVWSFKRRIIGRPVAGPPSPMPPTLREEVLRITLP
jgi:hypothetical protein